MEADSFIIGVVPCALLDGFVVALVVVVFVDVGRLELLISVVRVFMRVVVNMCLLLALVE